MTVTRVPGANCRSTSLSGCSSSIAWSLTLVTTSWALIPARSAGDPDVFGAAWRRRIRHLDGAVQGADHALGHAVLLTEWTADGDRQLADLQGTRIAPAQRRQVLGIDF